MPGHFSYNGPYLREFKNIVDTLPDSYWLKKIILCNPTVIKSTENNYKKRRISNISKPTYLIHNIDAAFKSWKPNLGWNLYHSRIFVNIYYPTVSITSYSTIGRIRLFPFTKIKLQKRRLIVTIKDILRSNWQKKHLLSFIAANKPLPI